MCEKATEIQGLMPFKDRASHCIYPSSSVNGICIVVGNFFYTPAPEYQWWEGIWLPRQDQLQEMVHLIPEALISSFYCFEQDNDYPFETMEQFTLAYVMKCCYRKVWNGLGWVKEEV